MRELQNIFRKRPSFLFLLIAVSISIAAARSAPAQGSWETKAPMPEARMYAAVTAYGGSVYVFGGANLFGTSTATPLVYSPTSNSWATAAPDSTSRRCSAMAVTVNSRIYLLGGWANCDSSSPLGNTSIFDPATNTWTAGASMPTPRGDAVAEAIDGKIYVTSGGNFYGFGMISQTEIYDTVTNTWSSGAPIPLPVRNAASASLNGKLYVISGLDQTTNTLRPDVQVYDPVYNSWSSAAAFPSPRQLHEAGNINGKIFVSAGNDASSFPLSTFIYEPDTDSWSPAANAPTQRALGGSAVIGNKMFIAGGDSPSSPIIDSLEVYVADSDTAAPTITINAAADGATYLLGQSVNADYSCQDEAGGSGLASCTGTSPNGGSIDTASVGTKTFTVTAEDNAGNVSSEEVTYYVVYNFTGFFQPVVNLPLLNIANAGSSIAVKFSISGDHGLAIFAPGYPASGAIPCDANEPGSEIEETVNSGGSTLSYTPTSDQYNYVWKTNKAWKGTCRILVVRFNDGTDHFAKFKFK
jgi:N-acetylneuraminic acid mutarotase